MKFKQAAKTYNDNAFVQKEMAQKLASIVLKFEERNKKYSNILEIGSGTGFLTEEIVKNFDYETLYINDLEGNQTPFKQEVVCLLGNIEEIEIPEKLDLTLSGSALQWILEVEKLVEKIRFHSNPGALFAFSTFGVRNFEQFKEQRLKYFQMPEIEMLWGGWEILYLEEEIKTLYFKKPIDVLKHIKATGVSQFKGGLWTKDRLEDFEKKYEELFLDSNGVELTYHPIYCVARFLG